MRWLPSLTPVTYLCKLPGSPLSFKLQMRWLPSLTPVTYLCKLLRICLVAAFLQLEIYWGLNLC